MVNIHPYQDIGISSFHNVPSCHMQLVPAPPSHFRSVLFKFICLKGGRSPVRSRSNEKKDLKIIPVEG